MLKGEDFMKSKYGIGIFILTAISIYLFTITLFADNDKNETIPKEEVILTDGQAPNEDCYYLYEINGYVVVFLSDKKTAYEYTDILVDELPKSLSTEIQNGKYIKNMEELYGFLENYSS